jgi:predicted lipoprotein with Yx(FWY)xxD motif
LQVRVDNKITSTATVTDDISGITLLLHTEVYLGESKLYLNGALMWPPIGTATAVQATGYWRIGGYHDGVDGGLVPVTTLEVSAK